MRLNFFLHAVFSVCLVQAQEAGMTAKEFREKFPDVLPVNTGYTQQLSKDEQLGSIKGTWHFSFKNDTLTDHFYSANLGPKLKRSYVESVLELYGKDKQTETTFNFIAGDTTTNQSRRSRINDVDTVLFYEMRTAEGIIQKGLFYTGNYKVKRMPDEMVSQHYNAAPRAEYFIFTIKFKAEPAGRLPGADYYNGMHIRDFAAKEPMLFPKGAPSVAGQFQREKELYGLKGKWTYTFKDDLLDWMIWDYYNQKISKAEFDTCLNATKKLIEDYTKKYGKPKFKSKAAKYSHPKKNAHSGYSVIKAVWEEEKELITVEFYFMGGKAGYQYLVKAEHKKR